MCTDVYGVGPLLCLRAPELKTFDLSTHLPLMFIGMEHLTLSNTSLAEESLSAARHMCDTDPLLINELGVLAFSQGK